ncbi:MAG: DNA translocase FtsK 4TM domain-containing protein, partial [Proteiniphilum sp.]|nr:DNA translocase FtsK 4TM domain-containing protein [Proteiniphilum sp.]
MAKRKRKRTSASKKKNVNRFAFLQNERVHFLTGVVIAFTGIFLLLAIISFFFTGAADQSRVLNRSFFELIRSGSSGVDNWTGAGGAFLAELLVNDWFGIFSVLIPLFLIYIGLRIMKVSDFSFMKALFISAFGMICGSIASAFILGRLFPDTHVKWGGAHGTQIEQLLESSVGWPGVALLTLLFIVSLAVILRKSSIYTIQKSLVNSKPSFFRQEEQEELPEEEEERTDPVTEKRPGLLSRLFTRIRMKRAAHRNSDDEQEPAEEETSGTDDPVTSVTYAAPAKRSLSLQDEGLPDDFEVVVPRDDEPLRTGLQEPFPADDQDKEPQPGLQEDYDPRKDLSTFRFPTMNLLKVYNTADRAVDMNEQNENKERIIHTLRNYGIEITSIKATVGPTITLYEIVPQAGVRISKIRNLEDDIALSLSALGIRIIAPMPGKGTIGIEVPN